MPMNQYVGATVFEEGTYAVSGYNSVEAAESAAEAMAIALPGYRYFVVPATVYTFVPEETP